MACPAHGTKRPPCAASAPTPPSRKIRGRLGGSVSRLSRPVSNPGSADMPLGPWEDETDTRTLYLPPSSLWVPRSAAFPQAIHSASSPTVTHYAKGGLPLPYPLLGGLPPSLSIQCGGTLTTRSLLSDSLSPCPHSHPQITPGEFLSKTVKLQNG